MLLSIPHTALYIPYRQTKKNSNDVDKACINNFPQPLNPHFGGICPSTGDFIHNLWVCGQISRQNLLAAVKTTKSAKNMQRMHCRKAGIRRGKREYIGEGEFLHRGVDGYPPSSTVYPTPKRQADQGLELLFHSIHMACCNCCYIIYLLQLFCIWAAVHTAEKTRFGAALCPDPCSI